MSAYTSKQVADARAQWIRQSVARGVTREVAVRVWGRLDHETRNGLIDLAVREAHERQEAAP